MSSMKQRGLVGLALVGALLAAGCPAPTSAPGTGNGNATPKPSATGTPKPSATATPAAGSEDGEKEPNNDFAQAQALTLGEALSAKASTDDPDFFSVAIPAGSQDGRLTFTINETSEDMTPYVTLFDSGKNQLNNEGASGRTATPFVTTLGVTAGKTYYIKLEGASATVPYTIKAELATVPDTFEPNNSFDTAKAVMSGTPVDLFLFAGKDTNGGSDEDYFKIDVPEGKTQLKFEIENKSTAAEGQTHYITVFNSAKEQINNFGASNNQANLMETIEVQAAGTYYFKVEASNSPVASKLTVSAM